MADDNESQDPERASLGAPFLQTGEGHEKSELPDPQLAAPYAPGHLDSEPDGVGSDCDRYS